MDTRRDAAEETPNGGANGFYKFFHSSHQIGNADPSDVTVPTDKAVSEFVNSSIATNTGWFRGTYERVEDLPAEGVKPNDYAFVVTEVGEERNPEYDRYKYTEGGWRFEHRLNNSGFTAAQWAAIMSGLAAADKARLDAMEDGAQENRIETVKVNGTEVSIEGKSVDVTVPTKTSDIENDSDFATNEATVHKSGDETVEGTKTFSDSSVVPNTTMGTDEDSGKVAATGWVGRKISAWWDNLRKNSAVEFAKSVKAAGGFIGNLTGDVTGHASGDVPTSRKVAGHALTMDVELTASDVGALPDTTVIPSAIDILKTIYPVGSVYIGTMSTCPMQKLFGTWTLIEGRYLLGSGTLVGTSEYRSAGATVSGGIPSVSGDATVSGTTGSTYVGGTTNTTGAHKHELLWDAAAGSWTWAIDDRGTETSDAGYTPENGTIMTAKGDHSHTVDCGYHSHSFSGTASISFSGGVYGGSNTVRPPSFVVNIWRRTA